MEVSFSLFMNILIGSAVLLLYMGFGLIFDPIPVRLKGSIFDISRRYLGVAFLVLPTITFVYYFGGYINMPPYLGEAMNLTGYFIISELVAIAFMPLVIGGYKFNRADIIKRLFTSLLYSSPMWIAIWAANTAIIEYVLYIVSAVLLCTILYKTIEFLKLYNIAVKRASNFYDNDIGYNIQWLRNSIYLIILLGVVSCFAAFLVPESITLAPVVMLFTLSIFIYIYKSAYRFIVTYGLIAEHTDTVAKEELYVIPTEDEMQPKQLSVDVAAHIKKELELWVDEKKYTRKELNINSVARDIYTNRTYLSTYINNVYSLSFRIWITNLRVEEAKRILIADNAVSMAKISDMVGFSSPASFAHIFKRQEGMPPLVWRSEKLRGL